MAMQEAGGNPIPSPDPEQGCLAGQGMPRAQDPHEQWLHGQEIPLCEEEAVEVGTVG